MEQQNELFSSFDQDFCMADMRLQNPGAFDLSLHNSSPLFAASSDDI